MALLINLPEPHIPVIYIIGFMHTDVDFAVYEIGDFINQIVHNYLH